MIAAALAFAASSWSMEFEMVRRPTPLASASDSGEVVVTGNRVRKLKLEVKLDRKTGARTCRLKRESGDPKLDAALCDEALTCTVPPFKNAQLEACMVPRILAMLKARYPDEPLTRTPAPHD